VVGDAVDARGVEFDIEERALIKGIQTADNEGVAFLADEVYDAKGDGVGTIGRTRGKHTDWLFAKRGGGALDGAIGTISKIEDVEMGSFLNVDEAVLILWKNLDARFVGGKTALAGGLFFFLVGTVDDADGGELIGLVHKNTP
jgi:hypothetical protein